MYNRRRHVHRAHRHRRLAFAVHPAPDKQRHIIIERAGVRLLFTDPQLRQRFQNHAGLDFELTGQLIDANFTHTMTFRGLRVLRPERTDFTTVPLLLFRIPVRQPELPRFLSYQIHFQPP